MLNGHSDVLAGALVCARRDELWSRIRRERASRGAVLGPFEAWLLLRGMRTLYLRAAAASRGAQRVAEALQAHPNVSEVFYPGLPDHPSHFVAARQMKDGFGALLSFRVRGGEAAARAVAARTRVVKQATSLGGVESLIEHRASIEGAASGLPDDLLRLWSGSRTRMTWWRICARRSRPRRRWPDSGGVTSLLPIGVKMSSARLVGVLIVLVLFCHEGSADAQSTLRAGSEFQVNSFTLGQQGAPAVAVDGSGDFVVIWEGPLVGPTLDIFGRRFNAQGVALATEFQINVYSTGYQRSPAVAIDSDGAFVVAWESNGQDGSGHAVFARRFNAVGSAQGSEFQVNAQTSGAQRVPAVGIDADGDFAIAWADSSGADGGAGYGIRARLFTAAGAPGVEFQVNSFFTGNQKYPALAMDADGNFVVVWQSGIGQDGGSYGVFGQRFNALAAPQGVEFQVNTYTNNNQYRPSLSIDPAAGFLVAWESSGQDGSSFGVFARRFNSLGVAQASEFRANTQTANGQRGPTTGFDAAGDFVIAWESAQDGASDGVFARHFNGAGVALAVEFQVNTYTASVQRDASLAMSSAGDFVVAWQSTGQDGSSYSVFGQRMKTIGVLDIDGNGSFQPLTDALLILRFAFGFTGGTLTGGAVGQGCTRCDATSIEAYLQSLV